MGTAGDWRDLTWWPQKKYEENVDPMARDQALADEINTRTDPALGVQ